MGKIASEIARQLQDPLDRVNVQRRHPHKGYASLEWGNASHEVTALKEPQFGTRTTRYRLKHRADFRRAYERVDVTIPQADPRAGVAIVPSDARDNDAVAVVLTDPGNAQQLVFAARRIRDGREVDVRGPVMPERGLTSVTVAHAARRGGAPYLVVMSTGGPHDTPQLHWGRATVQGTTVSIDRWRTAAVNKVGVTVDARGTWYGVGPAERPVVVEHEGADAHVNVMFDRRAWTVDLEALEAALALEAPQREAPPLPTQDSQEI